ncbi:hypothetical protein KJ781_03005 [Patescibacteria group bacterium]|nr:hypothetical protein [Patescibacteria group bacterium]MBU1448958.1 hypothetical protein [Patescibacteria group bacterium]MBU2613326.1 hypothetical protein [Patescibacteria group bacterium]
MRIDTTYLPRWAAPDADDVPDTERDPCLHGTWTKSVDELPPDTLPSRTDDQTYATDIMLDAGCETDADGA